MLDQFAHVLLAHHGLGHARERRELVHHPADVTDLADDGLRALFEDLGIGRDLLLVLAPQAFGRELDGRQRVLDLMRDAPRDIGPGRGALRGNQVGDVVKGHDVARLLLARALARHGNVQVARLAFAHDVHMRLHPCLIAGHGLLDQVPDLGNHRAEVRAEQGLA